ncbi:MAG: ABC transporter permease, partial [Nitrospinota bacterium]|nr:ABC transporter permease [Nitrospinota bacterium]
MELLLTYPLRDGDILMGKYLSALLIYSVMLVLTFVYPAILGAFVSVDWGVVGASYLGLLLLGSAFLAVGVLASSLTSNQIVAAMIS